MKNRPVHAKTRDGRSRVLGRVALGTIRPEFLPNLRMSATRKRLRAVSGQAPNRLLTMALGNRFAFRPVEENRPEGVGQDDVRDRSRKQSRDIRQPGPVAAATREYVGDGREALACPIAIIAGFALFAGGALAHDPGAGHGKPEAKRPLRAHCEDMAQHLKDPEMREETVEMPVAHHCIRVGYTIWPSDRPRPPRTMTP